MPYVLCVMQESVLRPLFFNLFHYCYCSLSVVYNEHSSMDEAVRVRNWPITVECKKNSRLWLVNFLLLQPHPYCYCSL